MNDYPQLNLEKCVWDRMLDADLNRRYYNSLMRFYTNCEFIIKLLIAITSSTGVASWVLWAEHPCVWKTLTSVSALFAIASPLLGLDKKQEKATVLKSRYLRLKFDYEALWRRLSSITIIEAEKSVEELSVIEVKLDEEECGLMDIKWLARRSQRDVLRSQNLA